MIENLNPYIDNLILIKRYNYEKFKIITTSERILEDTRYYLQGIRRYYDDSGINNKKNIKNIIINTYNHLFIILQLPIIDDKINIFHKKLKLYILFLDSLKGLYELCYKYNMLDEYNKIYKYLPILHKCMDTENYIL